MFGLSFILDSSITGGHKQAQYPRSAPKYRPGRHPGDRSEWGVAGGRNVSDASENVGNHPQSPPPMITHTHTPPPPRAHSWCPPCFPVIAAYLPNTILDGVLVGGGEGGRGGCVM